MLERSRRPRSRLPHRLAHFTMTATEFIVIFQSAWMSDTGSGVDYSWDGRRFANREAAIAHGFATGGNDDFNLGEVDRRRLTRFMWMQKVLAGYDLAEISRQIGLVSQ